MFLQRLIFLNAATNCTSKAYKHHVSCVMHSILLPISGILFIASATQRRTSTKNSSRVAVAKKTTRPRRHAVNIHLGNVPWLNIVYTRHKLRDAFYEPSTREYRTPIREQGPFFEVSIGKRVFMNEPRNIPSAKSVESGNSVTFIESSH